MVRVYIVVFVVDVVFGMDVVVYFGEVSGRNLFEREDNVEIMGL